MDQHQTETELIPPGEALKILTWVSRSGLMIGSYGTNRLTRYPVGKGTLFSRQECIALRDEILAQGFTQEQRRAERVILPGRRKSIPDRVV